MPYILQERREELYETFVDFISVLEEMGWEEGDMNYVITVLCKHAVRHHGRSYKNLNKIVGMLESAKAEFIRREMNPYEDIKIGMNGDVEFVDYDYTHAIVEVDPGTEAEVRADLEAVNLPDPLTVQMNQAVEFEPEFEGEFEGACEPDADNLALRDRRICRDD